MDWPFLTRDISAIPGLIKQCPEDFVVDELPLYEPSGEGTHVYVRIEKRRLTTFQAIRDIARGLGVKERDIGYAGMKDAHAVTRQTFSVEHVDPSAVEGLTIPGINILSVARHTNKLKLGHLRGNRFSIKLRQTDPARLADVREILSLLARRGVPNYFGLQRFGSRGDNWEIGLAMLRQDWPACVNILLGRPDLAPDDPTRPARALFDAGRFDEAVEAWPRRNRDELRACRTMAQTGEPRQAFSAVDRAIKRLYVSAYQSWLFNQVVAARIDGLDRLMVGDLAWRHVNGAAFLVEDAAEEQPRCDAFEISPSGPLFGYRMTEAQGEPGAIEQKPLLDAGLTPEAFRAPDAQKARGARRPLRFGLTDVVVDSGQDGDGPYIELRFALPAGCYATTVLREVCKADMA